jgi:hypothetical protein
MNNDKTYMINPCEACKNNFDIKDINDINQCCYDTLGAFEGADSLNAFRNTPEARNCQQCVLDSMKSIGRDPCDLRMTAYPSWIQAPHYFPKILIDEGDVGTAKRKCIELCKTNRYPGECSNNCKIDSEAVQTVEKYTPSEHCHTKSNNMSCTSILWFAGGFAVALILTLILEIFKKKI